MMDNERQQTNSSLINERARTDEAIESQNEKSENDTDNMLEGYRLKADQTRFDRRVGGKQNLDADQAEDSAIKTERLEVDEALERERAIKQTDMRNLLVQVRGSTDKDMLNERRQNDFKDFRSTSLLNAEQMAHATTRDELTTRDEFVAIVSHDLRNPIGSISSCADMLLTDLSEDINDQVRNWIEFIKRNADSSLRMISDILDMERIAEGKLELEISNQSVPDLINECIKTHSRLAVSRAISLQNTSASLVEKVDLDKDRIMQVLSNLIGNALKFTPQGGSVRVEAKKVGNEICISVSDTGPGIADDKKSHIFGRLAQIHNKDRRGLGLGLYISKMFVDLHGGKLWVESTLGQGSTFCFTLPVETPRISF